MDKRAAPGAGLISVVVMLCLMGVAHAANPVWVAYPNEYIRALLGVSGSFDPPPEEWFVAGRWAVVTQEGDPETPADNNKEIIYFGSTAPAHNFGYWTLRVGDETYLIGDTAGGSWHEDLKEGAYGPPRVYTFPKPEDGEWGGRTGGFILATWRQQISGGDIDVTIRISHVRDQARFELTIKNSSSSRQSVGLSMKGDVEVGSFVSTGAPFIPGVGFVNVGQYPDPFTAMFFGKRDGPKVPDYFEIYDNIANPSLVARSTLNLQDCVKPDYVAIGEYQDLSPYSVWLADETYVPDQLYPVGDFYWVLCWNQKPLAPGATREIVTYYGVGAATSLWTYEDGGKKERDSVVLAVQGPRSLKYNSTTGQNTLDPPTFNIKAYVHNLNIGPGAYDLEDVTATLYLPEGLELMPGETAHKNLGAVPSDTEPEPATWEVTATGEQSGELEYFVTAYDETTGWQQTVARKIVVPVDMQRVFDYGWQLVSVPFDFNNPQIDHVFGITLGTFGAKYWDPVESPIAGNSYFPATQVESGRAFWMAVGAITTFGDTLPLALAEDAQIVGHILGKQVKEHYVEVDPGWNMIGNPFVYPVYWGQVVVQDRDGTGPPLTLDEAVQKRWISKTLFSWSPKSWAYDNVMTNEGLLVPFRGYWLYARRAVTLVFRPAIFPESDVTTFNGF